MTQTAVGLREESSSFASLTFVASVTEARDLRAERKSEYISSKKGCLSIEMRRTLRLESLVDMIV